MTNSLLDDIPHLAVDQIEVRAAQWSQIWSSGRGVAQSYSVVCAVCRALLTLDLCIRQYAFSRIFNRNQKLK